MWWSYFLLVVSFLALLFLLLTTYVIVYNVKLISQIRRERRAKETGKRVVGFFHPFCNAGGGGERVLWCALRVIGNLYTDHPLDVIIYTGEEDSITKDILKRVQNRFGIAINRNLTIQFVYVKERWLLEPTTYPAFTLLGQSLGSILFMLLGLCRASHSPDFFIDTTGFAFTFPLMKYLIGCKILAYVHYPTISRDMVKRVAERTDAFNNSMSIASSNLKSTLKYCYYQVFAYLYGKVASTADCVMCNSTWTYNHILHLWKRPEITFIVYPPCDIETFSSVPLTERENFVLSVAQFRPEKNHVLQLEAFANLLKKKSERNLDFQLRLVLLGSCRDEGDQERVENLKKHVQSLGIQEHTEFLLNVSFSDLKNYLSRATLGLHTMVDEHFGIGVVEMMAAGVVTIAHHSGGPKEDIVCTDQGNRTGYLATTVEEYADCMLEALQNPQQCQQQIRKNARESTNRFSDEKFDDKFQTYLLQQIESILLHSKVE